MGIKKLLHVISDKYFPRSKGIALSNRQFAKATSPFPDQVVDGYYRKRDVIHWININWHLAEEIELSNAMRNALEDLQDAKEYLRGAKRWLEIPEATYLQKLQMEKERLLEEKRRSDQRALEEYARDLDQDILQLMESVQVKT